MEFKKAKYNYSPEYIEEKVDKYLELMSKAKTEEEKEMIKKIFSDIIYSEE